MAEPSAQIIERRIDQLTLGAGAWERQTERRPGPFGFRRIVLAVDGSTHARYAEDWARLFAKAFQARVHVVTVVPPALDLSMYPQGGPTPSFSKEYFAREDARARAIVEEAAARLVRSKVRANPIVAYGAPVAAIAKLAREVQADLVILGSRGMGLAGRFMFGSVSDGVKNEVAASVLIAQRPAVAGRMLAATDGSATSKRAVGIAIRLANAWDTHVTVAHVYSNPLSKAGPQEWSTPSDLAGFDSQHRDRRIRYRLLFGHPALALAKEAKEGIASLVVMGSRGLGGVRSLLLGSVSGRLIHEAETSVLIVKDALPLPGRNGHRA